MQTEFMFDMQQYIGRNNLSKCLSITLTIKDYIRIKLMMIDTHFISNYLYVYTFKWQLVYNRIILEVIFLIFFLY